MKALIKNKFLITAFATFLLVSISISMSTVAEEKISPEQAQAMMEQMIPPMIRTMCGTILDYFADPVVAEKEAAHARNLYEALLKKGFSKDEAMAIVLEYGSPLQQLGKSSAE